MRWDETVYRYEISQDGLDQAADRSEERGVPNEGYQEDRKASNGPYPREEIQVRWFLRPGRYTSAIVHIGSRGTHLGRGIHFHHLT
jgi:hypothetical protein